MWMVTRWSCAKAPTIQRTCMTRVEAIRTLLEEGHELRVASLIIMMTTKIMKRNLIGSRNHNRRWKSHQKATVHHNICKLKSNSNPMKRRFHHQFIRKTWLIHKRLNRKSDYFMTNHSKLTTIQRQANISRWSNSSFHRHLLVSSNQPPKNTTDIDRSRKFENRWTCSGTFANLQFG